MEIDAVHLAIGLVYYGLLRVPSKEQQSETGICKCLRSLWPFSLT
jgi:hypothetical protein